MSYKDWYKRHKQNHSKVTRKLIKKGFSKQKIINYFNFDNMCKKETSFCPLYAKKEKCHKMKNLNCFFCACPYFRFDDEGLQVKNGLIVKSECSINSRFSKEFIHEGVIHLDCSLCSVPHKKGFVKKHFEEYM